ncbi:RNA polymerase sigma factor [Flavobacterium johnsoniae]|jgi:RNA polymerase sigma-70 factor (ECF subfamily)|uniref:ECF subfamily RNA polymerase sigma-24 subunit n=1 Tax=Flavobacterium johnsoniae (strain ATCC 17061 / DSM 2064 / JCM 8514 / BCRC 14874 / CCUG 350202 / NBRC 14942 / NCIMB 11054 / UW101) TaxID=376686 RepID=A5FNM9_FLAJ1|nr:sigma-70 family RNA polymerase sigma factor [Flavobacterium johnsoniae]ABQ03185.1 ECF subfamily RNA polymerase sigma-24 subunit [Flavobacterium johnsoniae UW101]OXG01387.1 RNA polymerase subunit sigma-24 [Flavobacterium johnsoniae UW101]WQG79954.1 sigma-70 family RNA polymerase sigma factor [Flavobacterium johnsoniae UW101]SHL82758.1 RNA polymerase sigma-70 factor, ECF subfamily [Flavobacterium johnsoniae]
MDNKKLILSLKKGNEAAFKEVYFNYYDKLVNIAKRFNLTVLTPEDFVQESLLRLYNKRELLNEDVLLDKQLFTICKNIIINHVNRESKIIQLDPHKADIAEEETDLGVFEDRKEKLYNFINQLPEQQQKIFTLHKLENLSYKEIAELTDLSEKTIANHIYLASKFIRKKIENH